MQVGEVAMHVIKGAAALDGIAKTVAMPAREEPARIVELRDTPPTVHAIGQYVTDEPGPLAAGATRCPLDRNPLADGLPFLSQRSDLVIQPGRRRGRWSATLRLRNPRSRPSASCQILARLGSLRALTSLR